LSAQLEDCVLGHQHPFEPTTHANPTSACACLDIGLRRNRCPAPQAR
jgi:hypothetical protein